MIETPPAAPRRRAGPDALAVVAHGRPGAAKIVNIGRVDRSGRRARIRRPAKLLQQLRAIERAIDDRPPLRCPAQEPR